MAIEEHEFTETNLDELIERLEQDDIPTNIFTVEDTDPMVILGKLNEVIANLQSINNTVTSSDTKADEALTKATQAIADATQALTTANGIDAKATLALQNAVEAVASANSAIQASTQAVTSANTALTTANTAISTANSAEETAQSAETKADNAVTTANTASATATSAKNTAEGIDAKATNALTNSQTAITTANNAVETAEDALEQVISGHGTKVYRDTTLLSSLDIKPMEDNITANSQAITNESQTRANADTALDNAKVDKVAGKGLSTEDFTTALLNKLNGIASGANVNVQADWNTADSTADSFIKNKPTIPTQITSINGLSGGSLTTPLVIKGGDAVTADKIALDHTQAGQITDEGTGTLFGFLSNNATTLTVGGNSYALNLRGTGTRPQYKGNNMALYSDIPTKTSQLTNDSGFITTDTGATSVTVSGSGNGINGASYNPTTRVLTLLKNLSALTSTNTELTYNRDGYMTINNGLLIQWGRTGIVGDNQTISVSFTNHFGRTPCVVTSSEYSADDGAWNGAYYIPLNTISTTGFQIHSRGNKGGGRYVTWFAIGLEE